MFERNDDVLYICYDNEGYMNTGVQRSSATPPAARTATTMPLGPEPGAEFGKGKNLPLIAMAHEIPYVATATVADLHDLEAKVTKAMSMHGARYIHVFVPCPLGWGSASCDTIKLARLVRETGIFPIFEAENGSHHRRHQDPPPGAGRDLSQAAEALRASVRRPRPAGHRRPHPGCRRPQYRALRAARRGDRRMTMNKPFAITLDPGSSLANKTGTWRTERPIYVDRLPPCNNECPAGEDIQGWLFHAESGDYEAAWRHLTKDNPLPAIMGRVCYHTCEKVCNRAKLDTAVGINSVERFLGDEALAPGLEVHAAGPGERAARAGDRCRPVRPVGRLPAAPHGPHRDGDRGRLGAGRHDALRHSQVPPAA